MLCFFVGDSAVSKNDDDVAFGHHPGSRSVADNVIRACLSFDGIRLEPVSVVDVKDVDHLIGEDVRGFQQQLVDGNATLVADVASGDSGPVYLAPQHRSHLVPPLFASVPPTDQAGSRSHSVRWLSPCRSYLSPRLWEWSGAPAPRRQAIAPALFPAGR